MNYLNECLKNEFYSPIILYNYYYPSVYHAYEVNKRFNKILLYKLHKLKKLEDFNEELKKYKIVNNWNDIKNNVMIDALLNKFFYYEKYKIKLLNTDNDELINEYDYGKQLVFIKNFLK